MRPPIILDPTVGASLLKPGMRLSELHAPWRTGVVVAPHEIDRAELAKFAQIKGRPFSLVPMRWDDGTVGLGVRSSMTRVELWPGRRVLDKASSPRRYGVIAPTDKHRLLRRRLRGSPSPPIIVEWDDGTVSAAAAENLSPVIVS